MNFNIVAACFFIVIFGTVMTEDIFGEIDPLTEINFLESGLIYSNENKFYVSNDIDIREFFNGDIVRISGQTVEGFPYITYSKISDGGIDTHGIIFINNQLSKLSFVEKVTDDEEVKDKQDDLTVAVQYSQRVYSKQFISLDLRVFEKDQNIQSNYNQNYGYISNTNIKITIISEEDKEVFSSTGITNDKGWFQTKYQIPDNSKRETLTIVINVENENSSSSKTLQVFVLGNIPTDSNP